VTAVDDLVQFLRARLDEDAARAEAAGGDSWRRQEHPSETVAVYDSKGEPVVYDEGWPSEAQAEHIVRHDPARVLRGIEADRALLNQYVEVAANDVNELEYAHGWANALGFAVRLRGIRFADHPDYREEWRP
jgi:hypothetical protein